MAYVDGADRRMHSDDDNAYVDWAPNVVRRITLPDTVWASLDALARARGYGGTLGARDLIMSLIHEEEARTGQAARVV